MFSSVYARVLVIAAGMLFAGAVASPYCARAQTPTSDKPDNRAPTVLTLRWSARPGVSRYRLQVSADAAFTNIVFDGVVHGREYTISDLTPGRYFWRVAPLTAGLGHFSSAEVIRVTPAPTANLKTSTENVGSSNAITNRADSPTISAGGGWFAAVGNVNKSIVAHLRTQTSSELITVTDDGRIVAIDALNGRALWTFRQQAPGTKSSIDIPSALPLAIQMRNGLDNVLLLSSTATLLEGRTGRVLWRASVPGLITRATVSRETVFALDSSLRKLFILSAADGRLVSGVQLARRAVGEPAALLRNGASAVAIALEDGRLQLFAESGKVIGEGNAGAPATTSPLVVKTSRGELFLVGTSNGLTALDADDLRPLGRVTFSGDQPRGTLTARDLNRDGIAEVITFTDRGRVVVVKSDEGKIVWEADATQADSAAFADLNGDGLLDLLLAGKENVAFALSGHDGAMIWKGNSRAGVATNHATSRSAGSPFAVQTPAGILLITTDSYGGGLRAVEFPDRATTPR